MHVFVYSRGAHMVAISEDGQSLVRVNSSLSGAREAVEQLTAEADQVAVFAEGRVLFDGNHEHPPWVTTGITRLRGLPKTEAGARVLCAAKAALKAAQGVLLPSDTWVDEQTLERLAAEKPKFEW